MPAINGNVKVVLERLTSMEKRMDERHIETRESIRQEVSEIKLALEKNNHEHEIFFNRTNENSRNISNLQFANKWMWGFITTFGVVGAWIGDKVIEIWSLIKK